MPTSISQSAFISCAVTQPAQERAAVALQAVQHALLAPRTSQAPGQGWFHSPQTLGPSHAGVLVVEGVLPHLRGLTPLPSKS